MDAGTAVRTHFCDQTCLPSSNDSPVRAISKTGTTCNAEILINDKRHNILLSKDDKAIITPLVFIIS
jgi:hypothetical protein